MATLWFVSSFRGTGLEGMKRCGARGEDKRGGGVVRKSRRTRGRHRVRECNDPAAEEKLMEVCGVGDGGRGGVSGGLGIGEGGVEGVCILHREAQDEGGGGGWGCRGGMQVGAVLELDRFGFS